MNIFNYLIIKALVKIKYANIINFAANEEIIPELLNSNSNSKNIFKNLSNFLEDPNKIKEQVERTQSILSQFKNSIPASEKASKAIVKFL